jgi:hypothetical protein
MYKKDKPTLKLLRSIAKYHAVELQKTTLLSVESLKYGENKTEWRIPLCSLVIIVF